MSNKLNADELLREAFEVLAPYGGGSSAEADRKTALREKIARYLGAQGKPVAGGGGGGPVMFGGGDDTRPAKFQSSGTYVPSPTNTETDFRVVAEWTPPAARKKAGHSD
ncbi:hypothetical protein PQR71_31810 [Paraburkholderia fungorum]|uniref:hypothetical protein n=1 Tax=Paraburkholderia fungorum TaxID=134537 RepID=UPI0038BC217E